MIEFFDYTDAAKNEATVRLADGSTVDILFNPAGVDGWLVDVIYAYYGGGDDVLTWDVDGTGYAGTPNIVEVL
jgi:hypothetical protein